MPRDGDPPRRDKELASRKDSALHKELIETFQKVRKGFQDQEQRADQIADFWDIYNCKLNANQYYNGNASLFVPIVRDAVDALVTRLLNQLFPNSGRYIDATSSDGQTPTDIVALLEHYIRRAQMKTQVVHPLLTNGYVEGHYNLYVDWERIERHTVARTTRPAEITIPGIEGPISAPGSEVLSLEPEAIIDEGPDFEVIHDTDVLVLPATAKSIDDALSQGGSVTIIRRWTKETLKQKIEAGEVARGPSKELLEISANRDVIERSMDKSMIDAAGIRAGGSIFQIYETWKILPTDEGRRLCRSYYGGYDLILSARRNPKWNDRCALLSVPQQKVAGSFKGVSRIAGGVDTLQYQANDIANQGADSATYSMLPIIRADPAEVRTSTLILNLAAIWEAKQGSVEFLQFPPLWRDAIPQIQAYTAQIFQRMGVSPAILPQQTGRPGAKRNQAEVALEQSVELLMTATEASVVEEGIMTPAAEMMVDYDHQFRESEVEVKAFGDLGVAAKMEPVKPQQNRKRYQFTWFGVEQAKNAAQMQQLIAAANVARGMAPDLLKAGYQFDPAPMIVSMFGALLGWRQGRKVIRDLRSQNAMSPETENMLLEEGFDVWIHPLDIEPAHIPVHLPLLQHPDPVVRAKAKDHLMRHQMQGQMKAQGGMAQAAAAGQQGPQPGPGAPQPGAQPQNVRSLRGPPGMIHADQMPRAGAVMAPRKT